MKIIPIKSFPIILLALSFYFIYGDEYEIKEFEKVKVTYMDCSFNFKYIPKENEKIKYSDIIINIENNLNLYYDSYFEVCLNEYDPKGKFFDEQCFLVKESSSIYFNTSRTTDELNEYYIDFYHLYKWVGGDEYREFEELLPSTYEILEFYFFFINHEIPFDVNKTNYIFKFNEQYLLKEYSQDYFQFKIPLYDKDKILKIKIKLKNEKFEDLFTVINLNTSEEISYNKTLFSNKINNSENEYLIRINYLSEILLLYVVLDDEIIDLSDVISEKYFIFQSQRFYINLFYMQVAYFISPFETVDNGNIIFYNNKLEKYKERELESEKTCFYIEKINDNSEYYIDIKANNYIVYKFALMEDFKIINEKIKTIDIHWDSINYLIFPYNIKKEKNNDFYYGIEAGDYYKKEIYIEIIRESKDNIDLPKNIGSFFLSKKHIIIKIVSGYLLRNYQIETFYSNKISKNIKIYDYKKNNSELMELINNRGSFSNKKIEEYLFLYNIENLVYMNFRGSGQLLYYTKENNIFWDFERGFNFKDFENITSFKNNNYNYYYILLYLYVEENKFFQTNIFPELEEPKFEFNSYFLFGNLKIDYNDDIGISIISPNSDKARVEIYINDKKEEYQIDNYENIPFFFKKNEQMLINARDPVIIYFLKKQIKENIQTFGSKYFLKILLPNIKNNYTFYKGYGISNKFESYWWFVKEYNIPLNSDKEVRLYLKNFNIYKRYFPFEMTYGVNRNYYSKNIGFQEFKINNLLSNIITSEESKYFELPNQYIFYKCKNEKVKFYIGNYYNFLFYREVNNYAYFNFSNYSFIDILEIEANKDFLLFKGKDTRRNNNISYFKGEFNDPFYLVYEEPNIHINFIVNYIYAPKTDYYMENFQNECFIYNLIKTKNRDSNIFITQTNEFKKVLKYKYKEYLVTIVLENKDDYNNQKNEKIYYFYYPKVIKVSQKLLDETLITTKNFFILVLIIFLILSVLTGIITLIRFLYKKMKIRNSSKLNKRIEEVDRMNLI